MKKIILFLFIVPFLSCEGDTMEISEKLTFKNSVSLRFNIQMIREIKGLISLEDSNNHKITRKVPSELCFDFEYPVTIQYNDSSTVIVTSFSCCSGVKESKIFFFFSITCFGFKSVPSIYTACLEVELSNIACVCAIKYEVGSAVMLPIIVLLLERIVFPLSLKAFALSITRVATSTGAFIAPPAMAPAKADSIRLNLASSSV